MSIDSLWSLAQIAAAFALATALGFGVAYWLLPGALRRHTLLAAPAAGYAIFCLAAVVVSVSFRLSANAAVWVALAILACVSAAALAAAVRRAELRALWSAARPATLAVLLMLAMVFWPVLYQGTSLYLGTANIDFYQSLSYQEVLARFGLGALDPRPAIDYSLDPFFGTFPDPIPAKFGGVMFGLLLQKAMALDPRAALMTALVAFLLALPPATYLFARAALGMEQRVAAASALLIAVSGPVAMSFIHVLVGQNSSLALLPLALTVCGLAVRLRDWRVMLFAFLLLDAVFWMYVAMLPYVAAPVGLYALYDLARNREGALRWTLVAVGVLVAGFTLLQAAMVPEARQLVDDMVALLHRANRTVYVDFLTEISLPHSLGLTSYPITSSVLLARAPTSSYLAIAGAFVALSMLVLAFYFRCFVAWLRRAAHEPRAFALAILGTYLAVWLYFNFVSLYGYAIFKMAAWLQFFFVPFIAYGLVRFVFERPERGVRARVDTGAAALLGGLLVACNVTATLDFGHKALGHDVRRGSIVNSYGIGGNADYPDLQRGLPGALGRGAVVGIAMPDFIANLWTAYYVERGGIKAALVSHDDFPDEDAELPDVVTGLVTNSAGQVGVYKPRYHIDRPPYLLLEGDENLNRDIVARRTDAAALWANGSFILADTARVRDLLVTARGFYRLEYFDRDRLAWWWPERMRWSARGGEFLLLNASRPGVAHRLSFVMVAGEDRARPRHVEMWLNGVKFDEQVVHGAARVVTKPFHPTGGFDKLVVRVREQVAPAPRNFGLWNRHIALDPRHLNVMVAQARVLDGDVSGEAMAPGRYAVKDVIDRSAEFDGVSLDGWLAPQARIILPVVPGAANARMRVEVPGWAGYRFPLRVAVTANGVERMHELPGAGEHEIGMAVAPGSAQLEVRLDAAQSTPVAGAGVASLRLISLSVE